MLSELVIAELSAKIATDQMDTAQSGIAEGLRLAASLLEARVYEATRVVGVGRLFRDVANLRTMATAMEQGDLDQAKSIAQRWNR